MFHRGEQLAQQMAGYRQVTAALYPQMPEQHRRFYSGLTNFYLTTLDEEGFPVAAVIQGAAGFITTPDAAHLAILRDAVRAVPYLPALKTGMAFGGLGIDFSNRRRNRVNGVVGTVTEQWLQLQVGESFGNCPQYIQRRLLPETTGQHALQIEPLDSLDADARYLIAAADTLFVASHAPRQHGAGGADISHRGGMPGFVTLSNGKLVIPDYAGNRYMNTLGNLMLEPRCAVLIMDFHQGAALHIQGRAEILWPPQGESSAERYWTLAPQRILRLRQLLAPAGLAVEYAQSSKQAAQP